MSKTGLALLVVFLAASAQAQQGDTATLSYSGAGSVTAVGTGYAFTMTGTANLTGFPAAGLYATGTLASIASVALTGTVSGTLVMVFPSGDVVTGEVIIPAGYLVPAIGQSSGATGSVTLTGGTGAFLGVSGTFPRVTGSGTATGTLTATLQASGPGTLRTPALRVSGTPVYAGSMAHLASGGGWKSIITLVNNGTSAAQTQVKFFDESGNPLALPVAFPQGTAAGQTASSVSQSVPASGTLIIESQGPDDTLKVGSAQLFTDGNVSGFIIFRVNATGQEAVVPLQVQNAAAYVLSFNNTGGLTTGVALANVLGQAASVAVVVRDEAGATLASDTVPLTGRGHLSFVLADRYAAAAQRRGTVEFQTPVNGQISMLGIRAASSGAITTLPAIAK